MGGRALFEVDAPARATQARFVPNGPQTSPRLPDPYRSNRARQETHEPRTPCAEASRDAAGDPNAGPTRQRRPAPAIRTSRAQPRRALLESIFEGPAAQTADRALYVARAVLGTLVYLIPTVRGPLSTTLLPPRDGGCGAGPIGATRARRAERGAAQHTQHPDGGGALLLVIPVAWGNAHKRSHDTELVAPYHPPSAGGVHGDVVGTRWRRISLAGSGRGALPQHAQGPARRVYIFLVIACGLSPGCITMDVAWPSRCLHFVALTVCS